MLGNKVTELTGSADKDVMWWFHEIDRGIRKRKDQLEMWKKVEKFEDMYQWDGKRGSGEQATVNKMGSFFRTRRAVLGYNNPRAVFTPRTADGYQEIPVPQVGPDGTPLLDEQGQVVVKPVLKYKACEALFNNIVEQPLFGMQGTMTRLIKAGDMSYGVLKSWFVPTMETLKRDDKGKQTI